MSCAFGFFTVKQCKKESEHYVLECFDDNDNSTRNVLSNLPVKIGTKLYWEHNLKTGKTTLEIIKL